MSAALGSVALLNRQSGQFEKAELFCPIDARHLADFEHAWKPLIDERLAQLPPGTTSHDAQLQDSHWDWTKKAERLLGRMDYQTFALECAGLTQGLMSCSLVHRVREPSMRNQHSVYVDYLHTAPWNRAELTSQRRYRGVGNALLAAAISLSLDEDFEGRIGLHALPQSEDWYLKRCGMTDLGPDPQYHNLRYFEMTSAQAQHFLNKS